MAEDGRAALGLVGADALEDAGAVVEAVAENVDLGVVPGDELAIHPDALGLLHVRPPRLRCRGLSIANRGAPRSATRVARGRRSRPRSSPRCRPCSRRRRPCGGRPSAGRVSSAASTAASIRSASSSSASPWRSIIATERKVASGLATPCAGDVGRRAVDRLEDAGAVVAEARGGEHPERAGEHRGLVAEDVAEHVLGDDHVEARRVGDELHGGVVDEQVVELDVAYSAASAADDLAPQPRGLEHVRLVDGGDARRARLARAPPARLEGDPGDPLDLGGRVDALVDRRVRRRAPCGRSRCRR